ncbi:putative hydro-lyase [Fusibacter ferrireducens]|uniref:Putative hydro-lyase ISU02_19310 n=1 Tax=Fusibacter ferrireducens TaxID=2785058 RepID=A0ABR9ZZC6_9FIRM|nr:putative hydro-lyase [Fusibacter ferrireducens]MBF4695250.1 putative hydro-lyase [Fusibacter ferrireducens]
MRDLSSCTPIEVRQMIRNNEVKSPTAGMCHGYAQGNLVILPKALAYDFLLFTQRNPKPCPVLEVSDVGIKTLKIAKDSDIATDIPKYRVYKKGILEGEYDHLNSMWRTDFVSFILGCSFTFESALMDEGIGVRHIEQNCNVPMYVTDIMCEPAGIFSGPTVVSMRPMTPDKVIQAIRITSRYPGVHGAPIHIGDPGHIGIRDIHNPDFGDPVEIKANEIPVFWACGVTPQAVAMKVKPEIMITHAPGHMFITDIKNNQLAIV